METYGELRKASRKTIFHVQMPLLSFRFRSSWSFVMLAVTICGSIWPLLFLQSSQFDNGMWILGVVVTSADVLFAFVWLLFSVLNLANYRPVEQGPVRKLENSLSYFAMEQFQQWLSEISLYPQLCLAAMLLFNASAMTIFVISLGSILLLVVFALRIYTAVQMKRFFRSYSTRLVFSLFTNFLSVIFLLVLLLVTSPETDFTLQIVLFVLVLITNIWNLFMFYLSHLYEITLQSAVNVHRVPLGIHVERAVKMAMEEESFYKNMYPLMMIKFAIPLGLWIFPSAAVACYALSAYADEHGVLIPVLVWFIFNCLINYKTLLLTCTCYFTICVVILLAIATISLYFVCAITSSLVYVGSCCFCKCCR